MSRIEYGNDMERKLLKNAVVFLAVLFFSRFALADGFSDACSNVETFFTRFETILKVVSVAIVTIAIVFAGYQIAFAHKRISDVAPILIGGLLIGGAATIAAWFVGDFTADSCTAIAPMHAISQVLLS